MAIEKERIFANCWHSDPAGVVTAITTVRNAFQGNAAHAHAQFSALERGHPHAFAAIATASCYRE